MEKNKKYSRKSTSITISVFYEQYQLDKYNLNPPYQRDANIWDEMQQSFLIDSILKNFPMPPIFVEQKIDPKTGKTNYDVIDGKQRLSTIIDFISKGVKLPTTFGNDDYGYAEMNNKTFNELMDLSETDEIIKEFISDFWSYVISVEYIEKPDVKVVDNIFDRLNREGSRLNPAELRKAQYYDSFLYNTIISMRDDELFKKLLDSKRLADVSFITEIFMLVQLDKVLDGSDAVIDDNFENLVEVVNDDVAKKIFDKIKKMQNIILQLDLDYEKYRIGGTSHLYAIFYLAHYIEKHNIEVNSDLKNKLIAFFDDLRGSRENTCTCVYHQSMQSASKSASSRKRRVKSLLEYLNLSTDNI